MANVQIKHSEEKPNKSASLKTLDVDNSQSTDKEEKIIEKEFVNPKNLNKEDSSFSKEIDTDNINKLNTKEKNIITVDLTNDEKIVFSQLGINPLIKLGKEYITSNNFVRLKNNRKEKENTVANKKISTKQIKETSKSKESKEIEINVKADANFEDQSANKNNMHEEVMFSDKKDEIELTDEINNSRKKRRRSSASIE